MSYKIRRSHERKFFDHGWLKTYHTFSFASYQDPKFMGFRNLRVINEDRVDPKQGFPSHQHKDMEIITVVIEGELAHKDSTGSSSVIKAGEVQAMSAGAGVTHSEYNPSNKNGVHFLQIWILPESKGVQPRYQQTSLPTKTNEWVLIASKSGRDASLKVHQDVELSAISLEKGKKIEKKIPDGRYGWLQMIDGEISFNGETLKAGDGVAIDPNTSLVMEAKSPTRLLFFDLN